MEPTQELFLFVYTQHNPTEKIQLLWRANHLCFCSVFSIHEICIFWPFLSDMIDCLSHLIGCVFGRLADYSRPSPSVISGLLDSSKTSRLLLARICRTCWLGHSSSRKMQFDPSFCTSMCASRQELTMTCGVWFGGARPEKVSKEPHSFWQLFSKSKPPLVLHLLVMRKSYETTQWGLRTLNTG